MTDVRQSFLLTYKRNNSSVLNIQNLKSCRSIWKLLIWNGLNKLYQVIIIVFLRNVGIFLLKVQVLNFLAETFLCFFVQVFEKETLELTVDLLGLGWSRKENIFSTPFNAINKLVPKAIYIFVCSSKCLFSFFLSVCIIFHLSLFVCFYLFLCNFESSNILLSMFVSSFLVCVFNLFFFLSIYLSFFLSIYLSFFLCLFF